MVTTLTDSEIIWQITAHLPALDPTQWPRGYELNDDLVLISKETGRIWVPPDEQLRREILAMHHDGKIAGHLGMEGTLEMVT